MESYIPQKHYEQIRKIAERNPIVYRCLYLYLHGEVTWEEMLIMTVGHLAVDNEALQVTLTDTMSSTVQPIKVTLENPQNFFACAKGKT